jgi:hypothetical protein
MVKCTLNFIRTNWGKLPDANAEKHIAIDKIKETIRNVKVIMAYYINYLIFKNHCFGKKRHRLTMESAAL